MTLDAASAAAADLERAALIVDDDAEYGLPRRRRDIGMVLAIAWLVPVIGAAVLADLLPLQDPLAIDATAGRQGPTLAHWLGADQLGRDQLARAVYGARVSLLVGFGATLVAGVLGTLLGLVAGYFKRLADTLIMGAMDILLAFPALILAISLTSFLGANVRNIIIAIGILALPAFARIARAQTMSYAERDFVKAARSIGTGDGRIVLREVAPNIMPTMTAYALVIVAVAIVVESSLSFLGLGVSGETPTWGGMISAGRGDLEQAAHISLIPAAIMFVTVLALNGLGEKLRRRYGSGRSEGR